MSFEWREDRKKSFGKREKEGAPWEKGAQALWRGTLMEEGAQA
jgi:hypothetical protein